MEGPAVDPLVIRLALATVALLVVGLSPAVADDPNTTTGTTDSAIWAQTEGPAELTSHPEAGPTATVSRGMLVTTMRRLSIAHWPMKPWPISTRTG